MRVNARTTNERSRWAFSALRYAVPVFRSHSLGTPRVSAFVTCEVIAAIHTVILVCAFRRFPTSYLSLLPRIIKIVTTCFCSFSSVPQVIQQNLYFFIGGMHSLISLRIQCSKLGENMSRIITRNRCWIFISIRYSMCMVICDVTVVCT